MDHVYTLAEIQTMLTPILGRYHAKGASLFGSYARGQARPESDLDVLVHGGPAFNKTDVFAIAEDLFQASGKRVDVYEESELAEGSEFSQNVLRDRVPIA